MTGVQISSRRALLALAVALALVPAFASARGAAPRVLTCAPGEVISRSEMLLGTPAPGGAAGPADAVAAAVPAMTGGIAATDVRVVRSDMSAADVVFRIGGVEALAHVVVHGDSWVLSELTACVPKVEGDPTDTLG